MGIAVRRTVLSLAVLFLAGEAHPLWATHGLKMGRQDNAESAVLLEIAAELVRFANDLPMFRETLPDARTAWRMLQDGDLDIYPEALPTLAGIVGNPPPEKIRSVLAQHRARMVGPLAGSDMVLVCRADLPDVAPATALALLKLPGLLKADDFQRMLARHTAEGIPAGELAAGFLREKLQTQPERRISKSFVVVPAAVLAALFLFLALRRMIYRRPVLRLGSPTRKRGLLS